MQEVSWTQAAIDSLQPGYEYQVWGQLQAILLWWASWLKLSLFGR